MISIPKPSKKSLFIIRFHLFAWLCLVLTMLVIMILFFSYVGGPNTNKALEKKSKTSDEPGKTNFNETISNLKDLTSDVAPIKFETIIRDMRNYPDEFKDKPYIDKRKGKWTLEVMNVTEHKIITDYLDGREDRNDFAYFRFTKKDDGKLRYILMYGEMDNLDQAMVAANKINFNLPSSIKIMPEEMNRYIDIVDNYERGETVLDMSKNRPRSIRLQKTRHEVPVRRVRPKNTESVKKFNNQNTVQSLADAPKNNFDFQGGVIDKSTRKSLPRANMDVNQTEISPVGPGIITPNNSFDSSFNDKKAKPFVPNSPPN